MNNVSLIGRLTKDPELRTSQSGTSFGNFTLAINRTFKDQNGEYQADFINCVTFRKTAELVKQYVFKGHKLGVEGRLQSRSYDDKDGKRVFVTEVVVNQIHFLQQKNEQQTHGQSQQQHVQQQAQPNYNQQSNVTTGNNPFNNSTANITDDDLPF